MFFNVQHRQFQASRVILPLVLLFLPSSKRMVTVVSLDKPHENVKKIPRQSKWEISAAQWNPHTCHSNLFITAVSCNLCPMQCLFSVIFCAGLTYCSFFDHTLCNDRGVINATLVRLFQFSCTHGCTMVSLVQFDGQTTSNTRA